MINMEHNEATPTETGYTGPTVADVYYAASLLGVNPAELLNFVIQP